MSLLAGKSTEGRRKAAIAIVALGPDRAATMLRLMSEAEARTLAYEVSQLGPVSPAEVQSVLTELHTSVSQVNLLPAPGREYARTVLVAAFGEERGELAAAAIDQPEPFAWLREADPDQAAQALANEAPAAVALALAHLPAKEGSRLLTRLPAALRKQVATRIASLSAVHPDTVIEVDAAMRRKVSAVLVTDVTPVDGPSVLAEMLAFATKDQEKDLLQSLQQKSPDVAEKVREALFTFDDVAGLEARALQSVLKSVDTRELAVALKNVKDDTLAAILGNLSERARETLLEEIDLLSSVRPIDIAAARKAIVAEARRLEESGEITITRPEVD